MRILIISPRFPPANAADMQRVRMLLPYFKENGIAAEVLAVNPDQIACARDEWLTAGLPPDVPIHWAEALGLKWGRIPGLGELSFRALHALGKRGDQILASKKFDLVFFSTTAFEIHGLGPRWKKKFGVPFVMDYQDPWVNEYYRIHRDEVPPGGRLKHRVIDLIQRYMEPRTLRHCAGIISVSDAYPAQLARHYPWLTNLPSLVLPFPGSAADIERVHAEHLQQTIFTPHDDAIHWVYAGVVSPGMANILRAFLGALRDHLPAELQEKLQLHFIGSSYATGSRSESVVMPVAREFGVERWIAEYPTRIPFSQVLACLRDADALLVLGAVEPGYTASKIYPYLLSHRPLLAVFHEDSSVVSLLRAVGGGVCVSFDSSFTETTLAQAISEQWLQDGKYQRTLPLDEAAFAPFTAAGQTKRLSEFFRTLITS